MGLLTFNHNMQWFTDKWRCRNMTNFFSDWMSNANIFEYFHTLDTLDTWSNHHQHEYVKEIDKHEGKVCSLSTDFHQYFYFSNKNDKWFSHIMWTCSTVDAFKFRIFDEQRETTSDTRSWWIINKLDRNMRLLVGTSRFGLKRNVSVNELVWTMKKQRKNQRTLLNA